MPRPETNPLLMITFGRQITSCILSVQAVMESSETLAILLDNFCQNAPGGDVLSSLHIELQDQLKGYINKAGFSTLNDAKEIADSVIHDADVTKIALIKSLQVMRETIRDFSVETLYAALNLLSNEQFEMAARVVLKEFGAPAPAAFILGEKSAIGTSGSVRIFSV